ncbi:ARF GAP-like zinc finger-containing protein [Trichomonas vaginalis G3]|uniref:ARF GAP-like zinc finger-containing protein n=1 Tax=Trichomonas vaginalis (strain ATCC PRA-98 / G3) TaxID=412133 RepID=A2EE17_TRIV3|nr:GTPase activator protein [Trichomonas vaginalis G3]EAY09129.1 ARF GAP-like zinc finger-containing protein [Trichomonas vaginalis G3]KAI5502639.1 GTPase activator protein [Trichomonas vaginalis G3]|eukprot:XP_001321352.1 ARF GAP-like zinc finger-containing protein [Trichomonas vaginalis G3]
MENFDRQTETTKKIIENLIDLNQSGSLNRSGYLWKRGNGFGKVWHSRFVTVNNQQFKFFKIHGDVIEDRGTIDLVTASVRKESDSGRPNCLRITDPSHSWIFQCPDQAEADLWIDTIKENVSYSLDHRDQMKFMAEDLKTEEKCADCGAPCPTWCCLNWGTSICIHCSGVHRGMGVNISKVRSLTLDKLDSDFKKLLNMIGNERANEILLSAHCPPDDMPREDLIRQKYIELEFIEKSFLNIYDAIERMDFYAVLKCVMSGQLRDPANRIEYYSHLIISRRNFTPTKSQTEYNSISPLHVAAAVGNIPILLLVGLNTTNIDISDFAGWSPLSYAVFYKKSEVVHALMKLGVNPGKCDPRGNPYHIAVVNQDKELGALFLPYWQGDPTPPEIEAPVDIMS